MIVIVVVVGGGAAAATVVLMTKKYHVLQCVRERSLLQSRLSAIE